MNLTCPGTHTVALTTTPLIIGAGANNRPRILYYNWSTDGTPTSDQGIIVQIRRATALGTSTAVTPKSTDPSDEGLTFSLSVGSNCTIEPTYAASWLESIATNPRLTWKWQAYDRADEIIITAGAATGVGWQCTQVGGGAGNLLVNSHVQQ